jgi:sec-independent protein translocase protein TatB
MLRNVRDMARNATSDLSRELGTDIQLEDLNPKALIRKHLLSEEDERTLRKPLEDLYKDVQSDVKGITAEISDTATTLKVTAPADAKAAARRAIDADAT